MSSATFNFLEVALFILPKHFHTISPLSSKVKRVSVTFYFGLLDIMHLNDEFVNKGQPDIIFRERQKLLMNDQT